MTTPYLKAEADLKKALIEYAKVKGYAVDMISIEDFKGCKSFCFTSKFEQKGSEMVDAVVDFKRVSAKPLSTDAA